MRFRSSVLVAVVLVLSLAACRDTTAPIATTLAPPTPQVQALAAEYGASWLQPGANPHACFVSTATPSGAPSPYRYRRITLRLPSHVLHESGAVVPYRYRLVRSDGKLLRVVNCIIPRTAEAWEHMNRRLGVRGEMVLSGSLALEAGCVKNPDGSEGTCGLDPLIVVAEPGGREPTDDDPECTLNGCTGGGTYPIADGGTGSTGSTGYTGGESSCTTCGPQTAVLACNTVTRKQTVTCTVSTGSTTVKAYDWNFSGGGHTIPGPDGVGEWSGPAVLSGKLTAVAETDLANTLTGYLDVMARPWQWGLNQWSYSQGTAAICDTQVPSVGLNVALGWNVMAGDASCTGKSRVQPHPATSRDGLVVGAVANGPNTGLMYVDTVRYRMDRSSNQNPVMSGGGIGLYVAGAQGAACGVQTSWASFNSCQGVDMSSLRTGVWAHEGFGTHGNNGHEGAARHAASQLVNDPYFAAESFVSLPNETQDQFIRRVGLDVADRAAAIDDYAADRSGNVTGNWSGTVWIYDWTSYQFYAVNFKA